MDLKMAAAHEAISFIKDNDTIGLGAGSTMAFMVELLAEKVKDGLRIQVLTASFTTKKLLRNKGFIVAAAADFSELTIYFDGCDQFDRNLNALKSGGGIHTNEKLLASMAKQFFLVGDESKYSEQLDSRFPMVVELMPGALTYVPARIQALFPGAKSLIRMSDKKDGAVITDSGNYLLDVWFITWPDLNLLNTTVKTITGVIETSLFYDLAHKAIIAGKEGIRVIEKASR